VILIYGSLEDPPLTRTLEALQEESASYVLVAQSALDREGLCIHIGPGGVDGVLVAAGQQVPLSEFHSVYSRPLELPARTFDSAGALRARVVHEQLFEWLDISPALIINRPRAMQSNVSKPLQAQMIAAAGFRVPETLITNSEQEARAFWREHGRVVFKSISGVRSIVQELNETNAARLHLLSALPVQFQAYVPGADVRVHVVGERVFAAEIASPVIDYRYASRYGASITMKAAQLPRAVGKRCVDLARMMELPLAGIDFRRRPDGEYVCLEVNPMPAYTFFEANAELPISHALAELLINGKTGTGSPHGTSSRKSDSNQRQDHRTKASSHARRI
jgi:hypothetical protein